MTALRLFVAVELNEDVRAGLARLRSEACGLERFFRWTASPNLHLTLKFLGEVPEQRLADMCRELKNVVAAHSPFSLEVGDAAPFPPQAQPRLLVAQLLDDAAAPGGLARLKALQVTLETWAELFGIPPEKRSFLPHITLARRRKVCDGLKVPTDVQNQLAKSGFGRLWIRETVLFQSVLRSEGPLYTPLCRTPLAITDETD
jgi:2'-5' RNA ligase